MKFKFKTLGFLIMPILFFFFNSCNEGEEFPTIPEISFKSYKVYKNVANKDTALVLTIEFKDGDGDIGLGEADTFPPFNFGGDYYYNMYVHYYEFIDSQYQEVTPNPFSNDTLRYQYRLPDDISPQTNNKAIKGEINLLINDVLASHNPIKFSIYIYDRNLHMSNVVESPEIVYKR